MFTSRMNAVKKMKEYVVGREIQDIEAIWEGLFKNKSSFVDFADLWRSLAKLLNYPDFRLMRVSDQLSELIDLNNTNLFRAEYEDELEIIQALDVEKFHYAADNGLVFESIADVLSFMLEEF